MLREHTRKALRRLPAICAALVGGVALTFSPIGEAAHNMIAESNQDFLLPYDHPKMALKGTVLHPRKAKAPVAVARPQVVARHASVRLHTLNVKAVAAHRNPGHRVSAGHGHGAKRGHHHGKGHHKHQSHRKHPLVTLPSVTLPPVTAPRPVNSATHHAIKPHGQKIHRPKSHKRPAPKKAHARHHRQPQKAHGQHRHKHKSHGRH